MEDKQAYLQKIQKEFLEQSEVYAVWVKEGRSAKELKELTLKLRSLLAEIKALQYDLKLKG
jgi:hypothetical protein